MYSSTPRTAFASLPDGACALPAVLHPTGPAFTRGVVLPLLVCASAAQQIAQPQPPAEMLGQPVAGHIQDAAMDLLPRAPEQARVCRCAPTWGPGPTQGEREVLLPVPAPGGPPGSPGPAGVPPDVQCEVFESRLKAEATSTPQLRMYA